MDQAKISPPCPPFPGPGVGPQELELARAYIPWQRYGRILPLHEALMKGTLFPELYKPYLDKHYG